MEGVVRKSSFLLHRPRSEEVRDVIANRPTTASFKIQRNFYATLPSNKLDWSFLPVFTRGKSFCFPPPSFFPLHISYAWQMNTDRKSFFFFGFAGWFTYYRTRRILAKASLRCIKAKHMQSYSKVSLMFYKFVLETENWKELLTSRFISHVL